MQLSSFKIRAIISLTTFILLWFAVDGQTAVFMSALLPTLAQILLNDISYRNDKDRAVATAVAQAVEELLTTRLERLEPNRGYTPVLPVSAPSPKLKRVSHHTSAVDLTQHYAWLRERGIITDRQFEMLLNGRD